MIPWKFEPNRPQFYDVFQIKHTISFNECWIQNNESYVWRLSYVCLNRPYPRILSRQTPSHNNQKIFQIHWEIKHLDNYLQGDKKRRTNLPVWFSLCRTVGWWKINRTWRISWIWPTCFLVRLWNNPIHWQV